MGNGRWTRERRETEYYRLSRLRAERKLAAERRRSVREAKKSIRVMKDEVAKQIAQIVEDRAFATRPTYQILPNWKATHIERPQAFYKVVACKDDKFVSVYDGETEFALGKRTRRRGERRAGGRRWPSASSRGTAARRAQRRVSGGARPVSYRACC